jgi:hypothetical protein
VVTLIDKHYMTGEALAKVGNCSTAARNRAEVKPSPILSSCFEGPLLR